MNNVTIFRATVDDAARVLRDISYNTRAEFDVMGVDPAKHARRMMDVAPAYLSVCGEAPLTLFGFIDYGTYLSMWTIATPAFFSLGTGGVLATRRFFRGLKIDKPVLVVTTSPHPDVGRWLELLGFDFVGAEGERKEYRLVPVGRRQVASNPAVV